MLPNKKIIDELKKLAIKAKNNNEVPISAIIAKKNKIFFSAYNTCHKTNNPLNHAEMIVINHALKETKQKFLNEFDIYSSLEPCALCASAISFVGLKEFFSAPTIKNLALLLMVQKYLKLKIQCISQKYLAV